MMIAAPSAEVVEAWMKNHVCVPHDGIPQGFVEEFERSRKVDDSG